MAWEFIKSEYNSIIEYERSIREPYKIKQGENKITINLVEEWKKINTRFGEKVVIPVIVDGKEYVLMINPLSKLYRKLIKTIYEYLQGVGKSDIYTVDVVITKDVIDNRPYYDIKVTEGNNNERSRRKH